MPAKILFLTVLLVCVSMLRAQSADVPKVISRPVSYGIVIDNSGSYRTLLERVINLSRAVVDRNDEGDETFLVTFVDALKIKIRQELTADKMELSEALDNMFIEGGQTAVLDALRHSIDYLTSNVKTVDRRSLAILLISDGVDKVSSAKIDSIVAVAKEANIRIVVLGISDEKVNTKLLNRIAKETGGTAFYPRTPRETLSLATEIAAAIRGN